MSLTAALGAAGVAWANTDYGNGWVADPGQTFAYQATVQSPINPDGSSNFKAKGGAVIPVKFALSQGTGPLVFESTAAHPASNVVYTPTSPMTVGDVTNLAAAYTFTQGDCQAGSLRWSIGTPSGQIHVYFYNPGAPTSPVCTGTNTRSGANLIDLGANVEADWSTRTTAQYDSWANVLAAYGSLSVNWLGVIVDSGPPEEVVNLTSATFNSTTFTPSPASAPTAVCPTKPATISLSKVDGSATGDVNQVTSIQPNDSNGVFRIVDCKYVYNLATSSLPGSGTYTVYATIDGTKFQVGSFDLK